MTRPKDVSDDTLRAIAERMPVMADALYLLAWAKRRGTPFSLRDAARFNPRRLGASSRIRTLLRLLETAGKVRRVALQKHSGANGRPREARWELVRRSDKTPILPVKSGGKASPNVG